MKKNLVVIFAAVFSTAAAHAQMLGVDSVNLPQMIARQIQAVEEATAQTFRIYMTDNGNELHRWDLVAFPGKPAMVSTTSSDVFDKDCSFDPSGKKVITPGLVHAGLTAVVTPVQVHNSGTAVKIDLSYVFLEGMSRKETQGGCSVELPSTGEQEVYGHIAILRKGEKVELPFSAGDKYRFVMQRM
ncbi:hypothetical protein [Janthinobacterium sp. FW305-128]|uniref:hypothetical protein n=1 Tax=Janthinobacterium sp. FW305-128 TaxID=2775055 RepID=UPI001E3B50F2|nr:hypothetical protein [Janthinobacterium sp. FW305-128]MCC7684796.1 hypothetical protein [Janthinobacterium sp. FW305-128]